MKLGREESAGNMEQSQKFAVIKVVPTIVSREECAYDMEQNQVLVRNISAAIKAARIKFSRENFA